ncbi:hypothetical protein R3W88_008083 [Solanum pinnatisectum]|uniref:NADH-plastoquinone oxidoreductase subunit 4L n=1 Tax=Solanum pinnatisectum TaxID=50273 RepID=A0AAV9M7H8_9SOLN|nr:hypothetical protein R3W88_008083 [Solanum pinnatisectum]
MVRALMCLELILNVVNINFLAFSDFFYNRQLKGDIFSIFVIVITAAEAAIGLAIVSSIYQYIGRGAFCLRKKPPCERWWTKWLRRKEKLFFALTLMTNFQLKWISCTYPYFSMGRGRDITQR